MLILIASALLSGAAIQTKPNIVLIVADDLGYGSLASYGEKEIPTPNIDSIGKDGARLTQGYVTCPVCAPTRAALLTGRYQQRFGFEFNPGPAARATSNFGIPEKEVTIAEVLSKNGYRTGMVGKWHLGYKDGRTPTDRGFGSFFGFLGGANGYGLRQGAQNILRGKKPVTEREYLTDAFAREAVGFLEQKDSRPFFLYLAFNAVHAPMQAPARYTSKFPKLTGTRKTFAGMLAALDTGVGRVLNSIKARGLEESTLVIFIADNGGPTPQNTSRNNPLRGTKGQVYEGGIRVPYMVRWTGKVKQGRVVDTPSSSLDVFATVLAVTGVSAAKDKLDGENLMALLEGKEIKPRALFWRFGQQHAVRSGDWKLVSRQGITELFNLKSDVAEKTDLSLKNPEKRSELQKLYDDWNKANAAPLWRGG
jgi:arylsulfatase A-like enzyme